MWLVREKSILKENNFKKLEKFYKRRKKKLI